MAGQSSTDRVRAALLAAGLEDRIVEFPDGTRTSADAAAAVGCSVAQIAKSMVFRTGSQAVVVITSGANRVDAAKVAGVLGLPIKRADANFVRDATGFAVGGVSPVGFTSPVLLVFDQDLLSLGVVWAAAGSHSHVFPIAAADLLRITGATVADVRVDD
jgi:prolyl-tRNA editing enzyme YbaK/EbsC (Cys-tRNA(Pro) deacylase)